MNDKIINSNVNNVSGNVFNGPTNIIAERNFSSQEPKLEEAATYMPEPIWRSPITMALLTWIGFILSLIEIRPFYKIVEPLIILLTEKRIEINENYYLYGIFFVIVMFLLILIFRLRTITKKETRHPLFFNYAISGLKGKITIEKIHIDNCPKCGGKMKYYNKPVEWVDMSYSDGRIKHKITKRTPVLQCRRNPEHCYKVDPAEDKIMNKELGKV